MPSFFARRLLRWHEKTIRPLPWTNGPRDPYHIWVSEIIMQQTRIEQGAPYYHRFIAKFPTIESLAAAPLETVLRAWEGLGYYTRARNMHKTAQCIAGEWNGHFPDSYEALLKLPGIGPYSAAAISSFAYGLPHPVVDGNVKRLVSRFYGIKDAVDLPATHELIRMKAAAAMKGTLPAAFNQAIMNFGALVCKPKNPLCHSCPLAENCYAYSHKLTAQIPVRSKKKVNTTRYFQFLILHYRNRIGFREQTDKDIWYGLFLPPRIETASIRKPRQAIFSKSLTQLLGHASWTYLTTTPQFRQILSHQTVLAKFHHITLSENPTKKSAGLKWVSAEKIKSLPKPKLILDWLRQDPDVFPKP
ncbi:MAG TPA: A/G-specific adenine glycosylase [Saprospiraceae bacterium]|nr:A/G-specific adenine glycosylase [Saprospiraceae bacterium]